MSDQLHTLSDCVLILMFKAPVTGRVKTRLGKSLGMERAASIYKRMVERLVDRLVCTPERDWNPLFCYAPPESIDSLRDWLGSFTSTDTHWVAQAPGDLGERLESAFVHAFAAGARCVIALGADCVDLSSADIREAFDALSDHDLVIGPASDGGYWTIGLSGKHYEIFHDMPWSQAGLYRATLDRASQLGLSIKTLATRNDIDTLDDLRSLSEAMQRDLEAE